MSASIVAFNPGISSTIGPTGVSGKYTSFGTSLTDNPISFFAIPQAGKISYAGFSYLPDSTGDFLINNEEFIATVEVARYDFTSGCHADFTGSNMVSGADATDLCPFSGTNGLYFEQSFPPISNQNPISPYLLVNQNDLVTVKVQFFDFDTPGFVPTRDVSGKFGVTVSYTPNCYH